MSNEKIEEQKDAFTSKDGKSILHEVITPYAYAFSAPQLDEKNANKLLLKSGIHKEL